MSATIYISVKFDDRRVVRKHSAKLTLATKAKKSAAVRLGLWFIRVGALIAGFDYREGATDVDT